MFTYFSICLLLTGLCGFALLLLSNAPARLRFYVCLLLLAVWLTPWQLIQIKTESTNFTLPLYKLAEIQVFTTSKVDSAAQLNQAKVSQSSFFNVVTLTWFWLSALTLGLGLFIKDALGYRRLHKQWLSQSTLANDLWKITKLKQNNCDIRRINNHVPGMATGLNKPIIWLSHQQQDSAKIRTIVLHELIHIQQHDPYWLWLINLVQRLFWWNPIIAYTANYARKQMELSCDEKCKQNLPDGQYQQQLIGLTLEANRQQKNMPDVNIAQKQTVLNMSANSSFNLQRIQLLNKETKMKKRYLLVLGTVLSLTGWIGLSNASVNTSHGSSIEIRDVLLTMNNKDYEGAKQQLNILVDSLEKFSVSDQAQIWQLQALVLYQIDQTKPQITAYMDKALALQENLSQQEILKALDTAQALAASQHRWDKHLDYANKWQAIAGEDVLRDAKKSNIFFNSAVAHFELQQYSDAIALTTKLIADAEEQGEKPREHLLRMLMASFYYTNDSQQAYEAQQKLTLLYPSDNNRRVLNDLANAL